MKYEYFFSIYILYRPSLKRWQPNLKRESFHNIFNVYILFQITTSTPKTDSDRASTTERSDFLACYDEAEEMSVNLDSQYEQMVPPGEDNWVSSKIKLVNTEITGSGASSQQLVCEDSLNKTDVLNRITRFDSAAIVPEDIEPKCFARPEIKSFHVNNRTENDAKVPNLLIKMMNEIQSRVFSSMSGGSEDNKTRETEQFGGSKGEICTPITPTSIKDGGNCGMDKLCTITDSDTINNSILSMHLPPKQDLGTACQLRGNNSISERTSRDKILVNSSNKTSDKPCVNKVANGIESCLQPVSRVKDDDKKSGEESTNISNNIKEIYECHFVDNNTIDNLIEEIVNEVSSPEIDNSRLGENIGSAMVCDQLPIVSISSENIFQHCDENAGNGLDKMFFGSETGNHCNFGGGELMRKVDEVWITEMLSDIVDNITKEKLDCKTTLMLEEDEHRNRTILRKIQNGTERVEDDISQKASGQQIVVELNETDTFRSQNTKQHHENTTNEDEWRHSFPVIPLNNEITKNATTEKKYAKLYVDLRGEERATALAQNRGAGRNNDTMVISGSGAFPDDARSHPRKHVVNGNEDMTNEVSRSHNEDISFSIETEITNEKLLANECNCGLFSECMNDVMGDEKTEALTVNTDTEGNKSHIEDKNMSDLFKRVDAVPDYAKASQDKNCSSVETSFIYLREEMANSRINIQMKSSQNLSVKQRRFGDVKCHLKSASNTEICAETEEASSSADTRNMDGLQNIINVSEIRERDNQSGSRNANEYGGIKLNGNGSVMDERSEDTEVVESLNVTKQTDQKGAFSENAQMQAKKPDDIEDLNGSNGDIIHGIPLEKDTCTEQGIPIVVNVYNEDCDDKKANDDVVQEVDPKDTPIKEHGKHLVNDKGEFMPKTVDCYHDTTANVLTHNHAQVKGPDIVADHAFGEREDFLQTESSTQLKTPTKHISINFANIATESVAMNNIKAVKTKIQELDNEFKRLIDGSLNECRKADNIKVHDTIASEGIYKQIKVCCKEVEQEHDINRRSEIVVPCNKDGSYDIDMRIIETNFPKQSGNKIEDTEYDFRFHLEDLEKSIARVSIKKTNFTKRHSSDSYEEPKQSTVSPPGSNFYGILNNYTHLKSIVHNNNNYDFTTGDASSCLGDRHKRKMEDAGNGATLQGKAC